MKTDSEVAKPLSKADERILLVAITLLSLERVAAHERLLPGMDHAINILKEFRNAHKQ